MIRKKKMKSFIHNISMKLDLIGFSASTLCAIHCALMPFLLALLPVFGFEFLVSHEAEYIMVGLSVAIGSITFIHGYYKHHRNLRPLTLFLIGLTFIVAGHYLLPEAMEYIMAPIGALMIAISHLQNRKLSRVSKTCHA
jgi:hypothetical protein